MSVFDVAPGVFMFEVVLGCLIIVWALWPIDDPGDDP